ncbi:MAG: hypothetical protein EBU90_05450 [Proteobacteria bacterium]|nr:hypothetical protein [Pseudomonadota bacterium]NBP13628.1 hypothetical protein [bacterium]
MKVRIKKVPKLNRYQALLTEGQVEDPFYIPNTDQGQRNYVNAPVNLNQKAPGVGTVLQPGLMPDVNNKMVNLNNVNDNLTNENPLNKGKGLVGSITEKGKSKFGNWLEGQKGMAAYQNRQNIKDFVTNIASYERKADADQRAVNAFHMGQPIAASTQGTFDVNSMNNFTPGMLNTVPSTGDFSAAPYMSMGYGRDGGQYMAYGGRVFNQIAPNALPDDTSKPLVSVQKTLQPIPRDQANIEAEKDETIYFLNNGGLPAHYKIGGQPHSKGGTPLNVPEDSFVYSKALKLKNKNLFEYFNISKPTSFSDIAKKYDINKYRKVLADPDTDKLQRETAEKMIGNYNLKLGMLALAQESTKGFPQGLPEVGVPFTVVNAIDPQMILPTPPPQLAERAQQQPQEEMMEEPMMEQPVAKYGGNLGGRMRVRIKSLPAYQAQYTSGDVATDMLSDAGLSVNPSVQGPPANIPMAPQQQPVVNNPPTQVVSTPTVSTAATPPATIVVNGVTIDTETGQPVANSTPNAASKPKAKPTTKSNSGTSNNFDIDVIEGNPDFWQGYSDLVESGILKKELAIGFEDASVRERKSRQNLRPGTRNVFGDRDIHKGELFEDFKKRQAWYFQNKKNWDPENKADVKDFQREYCKRAAEYGMKACYFNEKNVKDASGRTIEGTTFDGYYGEHTFNAPGFNKAEPTKKPEPTKTPEPGPEKNITPIPVNDIDVANTYKPNTGYFPQDLINLTAALSQRVTVPDTWYAPLQFQGVDPAYLVPDYSPIMEAANIATQGVNAYGSRQSADASLSRIQGQSARPAAEHNLAVANANAGIYNNASQINAQIANQNAMYNNTLAQADFDARQLYEQDRIKAQNKKRSDLARLVNAAITNKAMADTLSDAYSEHFYIDPREGGRVNFLKGSPFIPNEDADMSDIEALDKKLKALNYSAEDRKEIIKAAIAGKYATNKSKNSYVPDYSQLTYPFNMQSDV